MKLTNTNTIPAKKRGMTLLELTVVILVLLSLIAILFVGARAWKKGSDRAASILMIRNVQQAMRSFSNMYVINPNTVSPTKLDAKGTPVAINVKAELFGKGKYIGTDPTTGTHPAGTGYSYAILAPNTIPDIGTLYMTVGGAATDKVDYEPTNITDW